MDSHVEESHSSFTFLSEGSLSDILVFHCSDCGNGYNSKMLLDQHYNSKHQIKKIRIKKGKVVRTTECYPCQDCGNSHINFEHKVPNSSIRFGKDPVVSSEAELICNFCKENFQMKIFSFSMYNKKCTNRKKVGGTTPKKWQCMFWAVIETNISASPLPVLATLH